MDMDISMGIHAKSVDMDMDMDGKFYIPATLLITIFIVIMWLVLQWTLPFLRACSMLVDCALICQTNVEWCQMWHSWPDGRFQTFGKGATVVKKSSGGVQMEVQDSSNEISYLCFTTSNLTAIFRVKVVTLWFLLHLF